MSASQREVYITDMWFASVTVHTSLEIACQGQHSAEWNAESSPALLILNHCLKLSELY